MMRLEPYRTKAKLTQMQLAKELGVSQACIGHYETGNRTPGIKRIHKIIQALRSHKVKVTVNDLFPPDGDCT